MNVADSERAATGLRASGYDLCKSIDEADVVLLNTCSVREKAEQKGAMNFHNRAVTAKRVPDERRSSRLGMTLTPRKY